MDVSAIIRDFLRRQHGHVAWWQLEPLGVSWEALRHRVDRGDLRRVRPGVYTGDRLVTPSGRAMAGVLAAGRPAIASHRTAGYLLGLRTSLPSTVEVIGSGENQAGLKVRAITLVPEETAIIDGTPCTTVARTLLDLAATASRHDLHKAIDRTYDLRLYDHEQMSALLARRRGHRGVARLRVALADHTRGAYRGDNPLEDLLLPLVDAYGLPRPVTQVPMALSDGTQIRPDAVWPAHRLIVELDGATHMNPRRRRQDLRRDGLLGAAGWRVLRFTWEQLTEEPHVVAAAIAAALRLH